ncbi:unnamed protein product [Arabidopsis arenosa]|uniref:Di19 C-terminal domain-containing protein n=1 Tax=Arabidopsis arenosa TaxID=38785 RepID=A0A8S2AKG2_ARAAE|nr:unnamed protein product [Arabidopsis arenosa]
MDSDSWSDRLASASRRYQLDFLSRSDNFLGFEEIEGEDDFREEYACPFCSDYFDIVSLCCHIDEDHPADAKNGVCPVCAVKSLFEGTSRAVSSSSASIAADPLLSSFISPMTDDFFISESSLCAETSSAKKTSNQSLPERNVEKLSLSAEDHREKLKQSEFVQGILSSMILEVGL